MKHPLFALLFVAVALSACATAPKGNFATDIVVVTEENLKEYWVTSNEKISFEFNASDMGRRPQCGHVVTRFLIDSDGKVFNAEII